MRIFQHSPLVASSCSLVSLDASLPCFWGAFCKVVSILLKLKGQRGDGECLALGPAVQTWPRVFVSGRGLTDLDGQSVTSGCGQFSALLCALFGNLGYQTQCVAQVCGLCLCSRDCFQVILSELRISLPSCQSEPTAEETAIKSARRI